jgi:mRNA interferase MazF
MRRGEIRIVDFEPAVGAEANKRRPAVIVSNDAANNVVRTLGYGDVTVVPLTSNIERVYSFQVLLSAEASGLRRDSKAQTEQIRAVAVERVGRLVGHVPSDLVQRLDDALRVHLAL